MKKGRKGTAAIRVDEVERLRALKGWSVEALAAGSGMSVRALRRILNGKPAFYQSIASIAQALGVVPETLHDAPGRRSSQADQPRALILFHSYEADRSVWFYASIQAEMVHGLKQRLSLRGFMSSMDYDEHRPLFSQLEEFPMYGEIIYFGFGLDPPDDIKALFALYVSTLERPRFLGPQLIAKVESLIRPKQN